LKEIQQTRRAGGAKRSQVLEGPLLHPLLDDLLHFFSAEISEFGSHRDLCSSERPLASGAAQPFLCLSIRPQCSQRACRARRAGKRQRQEFERHQGANGRLTVKRSVQIEKHRPDPSRGVDWIG